MITIILITVLFISLGLNIASFIIIKNSLNKLSIYEEWIAECKEDVTATLNQMRAIDKQGTFATSLNDKGTFESDDQVGDIFKGLVDLIEKLNQRTQ